MEQKYIIDTNIIIYYLNNEIPAESIDFVEDVFRNSFNISTITKIELLGWRKIDDATKASIELFLQNANVYYVDETIEKLTISIKQKYKIDTPDAIIAATALLHDLRIVTRNAVDFKNIEEISIVNPFNEIPPKATS